MVCRSLVRLQEKKSERFRWIFHGSRNKKWGNEKWLKFFMGRLESSTLSAQMLTASIVYFICYLQAIKKSLHAAHMTYVTLKLRRATRHCEKLALRAFKVGGKVVRVIDMNERSKTRTKWIQFLFHCNFQFGSPSLRKKIMLNGRKKVTQISALSSVRK